MATFATTIQPTAWGYFDSDTQFQSDADGMILFVKRYLGDEILSVELTKKQIWTAFEASVLKYSEYISQLSMVSNLSNMLGMPTGSNVQNLYLKPTLNYLIHQAEPYAQELGLGGAYDTLSGSIQLREGVQDYNIYSELKDQYGNVLSSLFPSGTAGRIRIHEVHHDFPTIPMYNSNIINNYAVAGLPTLESYIPDNVRFYVLPLYEDVLRGSELQAAQRIRRSHYTYKISGRNIRVFPAPTGLFSGSNDKLWIRISYTTAPYDITSVVTGSTFGPYGSLTYQDSSMYGVSGPNNVPFGNLVYSQINQPGRNWIRWYTLALSKEMLGLVRNKYDVIPIPSSEVRLNGADLITQAREDKSKLEDEIKAFFEKLSADKLLEMDANKAELLNKQLKYLIPPGNSIFLW